MESRKPEKMENMKRIFRNAFPSEIHFYGEIIVAGLRFSLPILSAKKIVRQKGCNPAVFFALVWESVSDQGVDCGRQWNIPNSGIPARCHAGVPGKAGPQCGQP